MNNLRNIKWEPYGKYNRISQFNKTIRSTLWKFQCICGRTPNFKKIKWSVVVRNKNNEDYYNREGVLYTSKKDGTVENAEAAIDHAVKEFICMAEKGDVKKSLIHRFDVI